MGDNTTIGANIPKFEPTKKMLTDLQFYEILRSQNKEYYTGELYLFEHIEFNGDIVVNADRISKHKLSEVELNISFNFCTFNLVSFNFYKMKFQIQNCQIIKLYYGKIKGLLKNTKIDHLEFTDELKDDTTFYNLLISTARIALSQVSKISFDHCTFETNIEIIPLKIDKNKGINNLIFDKTYFNKFILSEGSLKGNITIKDFLIDKLKFDSFQNLANLKFYSSNKNNCKSIITLLNSNSSDLKYVKFHDIEISGVNFKTSNVWDTDFKNIKWLEFEKYEIDTVRSIKRACQNLGNFVDELEIAAIEHDIYRRSLKWLSKKFWDKFVLTLNKYTNNYGRSWVLPLGELIVLNIALFILFVGNSPQIDLVKSWGKIFEFMYPGHSFSLFGESVEISNMSLTYDFINRMFSGVLIFQILNAFRKYARK